MASGNFTIDVALDAALVEEHTLHVPVDLVRAKRPARAVVWRWGAEVETATVVRMVATRTGTAHAAAGTVLHEALRGNPAEPVKCGYRQADAWDLVRYQSGAMLDVAIATAAALLVAVATWLTLREVLYGPPEVRALLDHGPGELHWWVAGVVLVSGLLLVVLRLRRELRELGS